MQGLIQVPLNLSQCDHQHCSPVLRLRQGFLPQEKIDIDDRDIDDIDIDR